ncbi:MAG: LysR family transcriptional regulator [Chthoniobacterales bacterium]
MFDSLFAEGGLSLERLRSFCMVADAAGVSKAALKSASRQSQFSRQIKDLETFFGVELMKRHSKGVVLTTAGKRLAKTAREILWELEDFAVDCKAVPQTFSIGAGDSLLQWLLFPNIGALQSALPKVGLNVYGLPTLEIVDRVSDFRLDFGLVRKDAVSPGLECQSLGLEAYALFVPRRLLSGTKPPTLNEVLSKVPLTTIAGEGRFRSTLLKQARKHKLPLRFSLCCSTFPQAARALRSERYAAILPTIAVDELDSDRFAMISTAPLESQTREICLVWNPRSAQLRPRTTAIRDCLVKFLKLPTKISP